MKSFIVLFIVIFAFDSFGIEDEAQKMRERLKDYYGESEIYEEFFLKLQRNLLSGEKEQVASLNSYPVRVNYKSGSVYYEDKIEFIKNYDRIVTPEMLKRVKDQTLETLFYNSYGLHIGYGDIWFGGICLDGNDCKNIEVLVTSYSEIYVQR